MPAASFLFLLRKPKGERTDERKILLRVTVDGKRREYATKIPVQRKEWDVTRHRLTGESQAVADFNQVLHNLHAKALHTKDTLETDGKPVTAAAIVAALRDGVPRKAVIVESGPLFSPPKPLTTTLTLVDDSDERTKRRGNTVAFQHNELVRAPYRMGILESRIFVEALRGINQGPDGDTTLPPIDILISAVIRGNDGADNYADVRQACKDLFDREIRLEKVGARNDYHRTRIVSDIELLAGSGRIRGTFAPLMQPYLLQLATTGNFTRADIATLLTLSPNGQRLYWYLKSYANIGSSPTVKRSIGIDELKELLLNDKGLYPIYAEFVRRVLEPIMKEFDTPDVAFPVKWVGVKTGKKTTGIEFTIPKAQQAKQLAAAPVTGATAATSKPTTTARPDKFARWLGEQGDKLQTAYAGLVSSSGPQANHLPPAVAQAILKHVAGKPDREKTLFATRHQIGITKETVKDRAGYSYKQIAKAFKREFK